MGKPFAEFSYREMGARNEESADERDDRRQQHKFDQNDQPNGARVAKVDRGVGGVVNAP